MALTADKEELLKQLRGELERKASFYPLLQRCYRDISTGTRRSKPAIWSKLIINPAITGNTPAPSRTSSASSNTSVDGNTPAPSRTSSASSNTSVDGNTLAPSRGGSRRKTKKRRAPKRR